MEELREEAVIWGTEDKREDKRAVGIKHSCSKDRMCPESDSILG